MSDEQGACVANPLHSSTQFRSVAFRFPLRLLLLTTIVVWAPSLRAADSVDAAAAAETSASDSVELSEAASFLRIGEKLVFKLSWGLVSGAGLTTIETLPPEGSDGLVRVRVTTESRGLVKALYPLQNDSTCYIDPKTGRPMRTEIEGHGGSRESRSTTIFDYEEGLVKHTDHVRPHRSGTAELPNETAYDIMVTMLKLRDNPQIWSVGIAPDGRPYADPDARRSPDHA